MALEYVVFKSAWDAHHKGKPQAVRPDVHPHTGREPLRLPAFYSLHAWLYKHNPAGTFAMWNPRVHCPPGDDTDMHMSAA